MTRRFTLILISSIITVSLACTLTLPVVGVRDLSAGHPDPTRLTQTAAPLVVDGAKLEIP